MKKGKYTEEQIIEVLKRMEAGQKARDLARELGVSEATLYTLEVEVRRHGGQRGPPAARTGARKRRAEKAGRRFKPGSRGAENGDPKKCMVRRRIARANSD